MQLKSDPHIFSGMQRDVAISKRKSEFLYDAMNIRFTARDGDTLLSITNEKGTLQLNGLSMEGTYLGHCVINDYVVVFTHGDEDRIYKVYPDAAEPEMLYHGNLGFDIEHPIETLGVYENDNIQKVYWIDGNRQPRVINVCNVKYDEDADTQFDFSQTLKLNETVSIERSEGTGMFAPGVIQYAFSYYNLYGQQSAIFYTSRLYYTSFIDRGGSGDDTIANAFKISISNVDDMFDYLRVYAIHRTSLNAVPTVRRVADLDIKTAIENDDILSLSFVDDGTLGDTIDPTELLYIGGETIIPNTMATKDNTLFFGNFTIDRNSVKDVKPLLNPAVDYSTNTVTPKVDPITKTNTQTITQYTESPYYTYGSSLKECYPGFKQGEHYRLGVQFQHENGKWSEPVWLTDYKVGRKSTEAQIQDNVWVNPDCYIDDGVLKLDTIGIELDLPDVKSQLNALGYIKARPICVFPQIKDRLVLTQGLLCPTVFNSEYRRTQAPFVQSSWFIRPFLPKPVNEVSNSGEYAELGSWLEFRHNHILEDYDSRGGEVAGSYIKGNEWIQAQSFNNAVFGVDQSILTMHSPDIEFDDSFDNLDLTDWKLKLVGICNFTSNIGQIDIETSTPVGAIGVKGFVKKSIGTSQLKPEDSKQAFRSLVAGLFWNDGTVVTEETSDGTKVYHVRGDYSYMVYPWHGSGSLNNDATRTANGGESTAVLKCKKISNLKASKFNSWIKEDTAGTIFDISNISLFNSDQIALTKVPYPDINSTLKEVNYYGNVDTILSGGKTGGYRAQGHDFKDDNLSSYNTYQGLNKSNAVRMSYKSTRHLVFSLKAQSNHQQTILPSINNINRVPPIYNKPYWLEDSILDAEESFYTEIIYPEIDDDHQKTSITGEGNIVSGTIKDAVDAFISDLVLLNVPQGDGGYWYVYASDDRYSTQKKNRIYFVEEELIYDVGNPDSYQNVCHPLTEGGLIFKITSNDNTQDFYIRTLGTPLGEVEYIQDPDSEPGDDTPNSFAAYQSNIALNSIISDRNQYVDDTQTTFDLDYGYLFLGELYRDENKATDFGGVTEEALRYNLWLPAGEPVDITNNTKLSYTYGDTWYTRYDCLKTYPFAKDKENNVIEIGSFMCESRVNVDGRYDKNRGLTDNLNISDINFNKLNKVYSQANNFFNYRILPDRFYDLDTFTNQITWSLEKLYGQEIDLWTNVTLANTMDTEGTLGKLNALHTFNDTIFYFQDNAFGRLLYNPRVQINVTDGVPIEIGNSKKMEGKQLLSDKVGCKNKWSICNTDRGIFFIDDNSKAIYSFSDKLNSVSDTLCMDNWLKQKDLFETEHTFYDKVHQDLYFVWDNACLVFNNIIGQFTSFMNYEGTPAMFNVSDKFYALRDNDLLDTYQMFGGKYNDFFGTTSSPKYKPFHIHFISNADSGLDKIFSTIETRVDFKRNDQIIHDEFFDSLRVWNEYQDTGTKNITRGISAAKRDAKKKFRVWRVDIPRCGTHNLNRIRNTWTNIKLSKNNPSNLKMELHDLSVQYFI